MKLKRNLQVKIAVALVLLILLTILTPSLSLVEASEIQEEILESINKARAEGVTDNDGVWHPPVPPLKWNEKLEAAALQHSKDMHENNFLGHIGSDGSSPWERISQTGYESQRAAENAAKGQTSVEWVMSDWLGSPGHCANIMNGDMLEVGVARVGNAWTQVFAWPASLESKFDVSRLHGSHRYETAVEISRAAFPGTADAVILARGDNFPDALAGVPLAYDRNATLLLTASDSLPGDTAAEIDRLLSVGDTVYILGGKAAISRTVADELKSRGYNIERLGGANRYETAVAIAEAISATPTESFLATGEGFADAVAASAAAAVRGAPMLLTPSETLSNDTADYLDQNNIASINVIGGRAVISDGVYNQAGATNRVAGANRWETAVTTAETFFDSPNYVTIATGDDFPDALSGGVYAAMNNVPVLLTSGYRLLDCIANYMRSEEAIEKVKVFGGSAAVPGSVLTEIEYID